jgi:fructoselysine 6-kinase
VSVGDCCIDVYAGEGVSAVGGNALNVAVAWAGMGLESRYLGAVGDDEYGARVVATAAAAGVDVSGVRTIAGTTGVTIIELLADGDRVLAHEDVGVSAGYRPLAAELDALPVVDWVHCATLGDGFRDVVANIARRCGRVSYDFSTRHACDGLDGIEVAFYSLDGSPADAEALAARAIAGGAALAVVTQGAAGSVAVDAGGSVRQPALSVAARDTCGAGDSYAAALVAARLQGLGLVECVERAAAAAAETCQILGAWRQELSLEPAR